MVLAGATLVSGQDAWVAVITAVGVLVAAFASWIEHQEKRAQAIRRRKDEETERWRRLAGETRAEPGASERQRATAPARPASASR